MKIRRNQICPLCNSGKKFKHCCGHHSHKNHVPPNLIDPTRLIERHKAQQLTRQQQQGKGRPIIGSKLNNQQIVAVGNKIYSSANWKTFSDFLCHYIKITMGEEWGNAELKKSLEVRHPILQWYDDVCALQKQHMDGSGQVKSLTLTGASACYLGLSYNLYLLQHNIELQKIYIERLKDINNFQGAYYELMVAGCLIRAGFKLELEDEADDNSKHCEFSATSLATGKKFWVEAKMRGVVGVLGKNETNGTKRKDPTSSLSSHVKSAMEKPAEDDRLVFIDVNAPAERGVTPAWIKQAERKLDAMNRDLAKGKSAYVFVTNMDFHWDAKGEKSNNIIMVCGLGINDFIEKGYFSFSEIYRRKKKHIDVYEIVEAFKEYPAIPDTFDGSLPSVAFGEYDPIPQIGETYFFEILDRAATVTSAFINEDEKMMYVGISTGSILTKPVSDSQLRDYKNHPDTFFGIFYKQGKSFDDPYKFFEHMVQIHMSYSKENIIKQMINYPDQNMLNELSHEDLVLMFCEGIAFQVQKNGKKTDGD